VGLFTLLFLTGVGPRGWACGVGVLFTTCGLTVVAGCRGVVCVEWYNLSSNSCPEDKLSFPMKLCAGVFNKNDIISVASLLFPCDARYPVYSLKRDTTRSLRASL